jgi:capsid protein
VSIWPAGGCRRSDWVDPQKDARAEIEQIEAGLKSRTQALAERGYDAEQVDAEIAADKAREELLGLSFGSGTASGVLAEAPPVMDENLGS